MSGLNQINSVYLPDKKAGKEKIVFGLSGGIDSLVAAYLLKIQKFELFAVTIVPVWDKFTGDKSKVLSCYVDNKRLDRISEFCQQLNIPHEVMKISSEFQSSVVEKWVSNKITGRFSHACWDCHDLRIKILYQKMLDLKADAIATGHFAKIFHHSGHNTFYVHSSNDEKYDQSGLLSRLPSEIIRHLRLPLSDLQKKEVIKLAVNFGIDNDTKKIEIHQCFPSNEEILQFVKSQVPISMAQGGEMMSEDSSIMYKEHLGVYRLDHGKKVEFEGMLRNQELFLARYSFKEKKVFLAEEKFFFHQNILLTQCRFSEEVLWFEPLKGFVQLYTGEFSECWIYPKCLESAYIVLESKHKVFANSVLVIYKRKGKNSKVLLSGISHYIKPVVEEVEGEVEGQNKKANFDRSRDF